MDPRDPRFDKTMRHVQQQWLLANRALDERQRAMSGYRVSMPDAATIRLLEKSALSSFVAQTDQLVRDTQQRIASIIKSAFRAHVIPRVQLMAQINVQRLVESIPRIVNFEALAESFRELMEAVREGDLVLEESEFGFADQLWDTGFLLDLAGIDPRVRPAVVTRKLATLASRQEFEDALRDPVLSSRLLGKRWPVIEEALWAHRNRRYLLSVPPLMAQVEGAIADAMVLKNLVVVRNGQPYLVGEDGEPRRRSDTSGKKLPPVTLGTAIREAQLEEHEALETASAFVADSLVGRRNAVLHGRDVRYGTAKPSTQLLLLMLVFARLVEELENDQAPASRILLP